ncbi:MAG: phospho-N-acetylmuramoyl-pentapeptide-transferase [Bacteroidetes bacterium]|nr:MAG: phospho-N-acetylmuramoyl-pentapeptide-transferase [Bacteroidota bacterium]
MLYYLFEYLDKHFNLAGAGVFQYISFRTAAAIITSLIISLLFGKRLIDWLRGQQVADEIRDLGLDGEKQKKGTPTMGGIIILGAIIIPTLLFARLENLYVILILVATIWLGFIGFLDDYIKVFKKDKAGLAGRFKILGQVGLGLIVGSTLYFHETVKVREYIAPAEYTAMEDQSAVKTFVTNEGDTLYYQDSKSLSTTIPFVKENEFSYASITRALGDTEGKLNWLLYVLVVTFIITAVSNGANITDGIDGLAAGVSGIIGVILGIFAYLSGNILFSSYLNIMYIPHLGELVIFSGAFVGACIGFLWYNSFPAQVFMGDTGSLALGGVIATLAIMVRKELLIPILCGIFLVENLSVMIQVAYFKYTKKKYGEGRRVFLMSPLHHHYQKKGYHESKIVTRFWIIGIFLAILTVITLKLR